MKQRNSVFWGSGSAALAMSLSACQSPWSEVAAPEVIDPESPGAQVLVEYCSGCHAPPGPASRTAGEWPGVVHRMQEQRRMRGFSPMTKEQIEVLVAYLQRHAGS